jgi:hypothetical protein
MAGRRMIQGVWAVVYVSMAGRRLNARSVEAASNVSMAGREGLDARNADSSFVNMAGRRLMQGVVAAVYV